MYPSASLAQQRRKPLAACCTALFAVLAPELSTASTWPVTSCADSGPGSLRAVVGSPSTVSGDVVDLSGLNSSNCPGSTISLTTGAIAIPQGTLSVEGPSSRITISGYYNGAYQNDRLINHAGAGGTLNLSNLNFEYSRFSPPAGVAYGGCINSAGSINLSNVRVFQCHATGATKTRGGGIRAAGDVYMKYSRITGNSASGGINIGGGVWLGGSLTAKSSTIDGNSALGGAGGGLYVAHGAATLISSTLSGNSANVAGGMYTQGNLAEYVRITNSTLSGNHATSYQGGLVTAGNSVTIQNSTIAFNTAGKAMPNSAAGVYLRVAQRVDIESSILSNNTYGSTESDFSASDGGNLAMNLASHNSIIRAAPGTFRPATVTTSCPLLGPLRDNGGPTSTHALMSQSPALGAGNNNAGLAGDQRGPQLVVGTDPYPRMSGSTTDIGAYEVQRNDILFNSGFEGCP